ncbi:MAG: hypothetical protein DCO97_19565, partial [Marivita sp. XM-24bin2]
MTPDFALTLSFEGISLLRRVPNGWVRVGDVALDAADLRAALAELRSSADALSAHGGEVKLVIPNEQIKYLSIADTDQSGDALQQDIRNALDGATPYTVDELSFDWSHSNGRIHIAAIANETLDEAETFAKGHHFEPVCFVASAPDGQFSGEVFFGQASSWNGATPKRDQQALVVVDAAEVHEKTPEEAEIETEEPIAQSETAAVEDVRETLEDDPVRRSAEDDAADESAALAPGAADPDRVASQDVPNEAPKKDLPPLSARPDEASAPTAFTSIRATRPTAESQPSPAPRVDVEAPESPTKPRFKLGGARKSTKDSDVTAPVLQVDATDAPAERKGFGFFSRRSSKPADSTADDAKAAAPLSVKAPEAPNAPPVKKHDPEPARAAVARIAAMRAGRKDAPKPEPVQPPEDERARMTVFGARTEPQIGGKPRFLGLMLTSALLVFLLAVAAWASVFLDEGLSRFFDRDNETPSIARLPDVELTPLDGSVTAPPDETDDVQLAALDIVERPVDSDDGLSVVLPPPAALTEEEADARYAATGIWQRSPEAPETPTQTTLDDLYVASIDGSVEQFDAVALPGIEALRNDRTYLSQPNPAAPGTRFDLDERGLVIATPEGAVNPDGVRIFAGLPPVVPPARPAPEAEVEDGTENAASDGVAPELRQFRPRLRP